MVCNLRMSTGHAVPSELEKSHNVFKSEHVPKSLVFWLLAAYKLLGFLHSPGLQWER